PLRLGQPALRRLTIPVEQTEHPSEHARRSQQPIGFVLVEASFAFAARQRPPWNVHEDECRIARDGGAGDEALERAIRKAGMHQSKKLLGIERTEPEQDDVAVRPWMAGRKDSPRARQP